MVTYLEEKKRTSTLATVFLKQLSSRLGFPKFILCYLRSLFILHILYLGFVYMIFCINLATGYALKKVIALVTKGTIINYNSNYSRVIDVQLVIAQLCHLVS